MSDLVRPETERKEPRRRVHHHIVFACIWMVLEAFLIFYQLGHYPLWGDEAITALYGQSIWQTGDANALLGHNLIAINKGFELRDLKARYTPPLSYYLTALSIGVFGPTAFAARLPNAIGGWLAVIIIIYWLYRTKPDWVTWLVVAAGFIGNVSFALFSRQSRYYGLSMLFSVMAVYFYFHATEQRTRLGAISVSGALLLATNYMQYFALATCVALDYYVWRRKSLHLPKRAAIKFLTSQMAIGVILLVIYNPIGRDTIHRRGSMLLNKIGILLATLRDINFAEFGVGSFLLLTPVLFFITRDMRFLRGIVAIIVYVAASTLVSPRWMPINAIADIRYISPLIPLCIGMSILVILHLGAIFHRTVGLHRGVIMIPLALTAFGTNLWHGGPWAYPDGFRSSITAYVRELTSNFPTTFSVTLDWLQANLHEGQTVWVVPYHTAHPMMYHFPQAVYAWQLTWPPESQFFGLDEIHFLGRTCPDYIIAFGPFRKIIDSHFTYWQTQNVEFTFIQTIQHYWEDKTRPELTIHAFKPVTTFNREIEAIYIYQRTRPDSPCRCTVSKNYEDEVKYWQ